MNRQFAAVFAGRTLFILAEQAVEGGNAREAHLHCDLRDRQLRMRQQLLCRFDAPVIEVIAERVACVIFKQPGEVEFAESHQ